MNLLYAKALRNLGAALGFRDKGAQVSALTSAADAIRELIEKTEAARRAEEAEIRANWPI